MQQTSKSCARCKVVQAFSEFYPKKIKGKPGYFDSYCKACVAKKAREYTDQHPEKAYWNCVNYRKNNPERVRANSRRWESINKNKRWDGKLKRTYGITLDQYNQISEQQNNVCAICKDSDEDRKHLKFKRLCIDHNHSTGEIRGLLCSECNKAIGLLNDDPELLQSAITYLTRKKQFNFSITPTKEPIWPHPIPSPI